MYKKNGFLVLYLLAALNPVLCYAEFNDPTRPNYAPPTTVIQDDKTIVADKLVLSAIWITASAKWATINGVTAKQGQTILNNVKIIKIARNTVFIYQNGSIKTLKLLKSPYKTKPD
jgi:hypothetical protein